MEPPTLGHRVFVAGATGAIGRPLVRRLLAEGYEVTGLCRRQQSAAGLEAIGARAVVADARSGTAVRRAVLEARPQTVIHTLTAVPKRGPLWPGDMRATDELRIRGTRNLLSASIEAGASRLIFESMIFVYGFGDHGSVPLTEGAPTRPSPTGWLQRSVDAVREAESMVQAADLDRKIEGIVLRVGFLYGVEAGWEKFVRLLRLRLFGIPGDGTGVGSWIHEEDAARAFVAAVRHGQHGEAYNIVDDQPVEFREFARRFAELARAPRPVHIPRKLYRFFAPFLVADLDSRIPVSNAKAKLGLDWAPAFPTYREGLADLVSKLDARRVSQRRQEEPSPEETVSGQR